MLFMEARTMTKKKHKHKLTVLIDNQNDTRAVFVCKTCCEYFVRCGGNFEKVKFVGG